MGAKLDTLVGDSLKMYVSRYKIIINKDVKTVQKSKTRVFMWFLMYSYGRLTDYIT